MRLVTRRPFGSALIAAVSVAIAISAPVSAAGFSIVPAPNPGTSNSIAGLVAFSATEIWGVGTTSSPSYAGCHSRTLTSRWNGSAFVEVPAPSTPICATVASVAGRSTTDILAVGNTGNGRDAHIRHWDGSAWSTVPGATIPAPPPGRPQRSTGLNGVVAISASDVWAVGKAEYADFSRHSPD